MSDANPPPLPEAVVLLAIATSRYTTALVARTIDEALALAATGRPTRIEVLYVDEDEGVRRAADTLKSDGFLGLDPQATTLSALAEHHKRLAQDRIREVRARVQPHGIAVQVEEVAGEFGPILEARARQAHYDVILLTRPRRPFLTRLLLGSEADEIARLGLDEPDQRVVVGENE
jgi:nucleotide-binding universal stress UspA family protein